MPVRVDTEDVKTLIDGAVSMANVQGRSHFLLLCEHASPAIPAQWGSLGISDDQALSDHISWDIGAMSVTHALSELLDAPAILANYSRLFIDCNRRLQQRTCIPAKASNGLRIPGNESLTKAEMHLRACIAYHPFHNTVGAVLDSILTGFRTPHIINIHTFTPVFRSEVRRWQVGVLWNRDDRLVRPLLDLLQRNDNYVIAENVPYSAQVYPCYTIDHHAEARGLPYASLEIRNDEIGDPERAATYASMIADAVKQLPTLAPIDNTCQESRPAASFLEAGEVCFSVPEGS